MTATQTLSCPVCQQPLESGRQSCTSCGASRDWMDLIEAVDFVLRRMGDFHQQGQLRTADYEMISRKYKRKRDDLIVAARAGRPLPSEPRLPETGKCWNCQARCSEDTPACLECGVSLEKHAVRSLNYLRFLNREIGFLEEDGYLPLSTAHALRRKTREQVKGLKAKLWQDAIPLAETVESTSATPRRSLLDVVLDPKSIQWLMIFGAAMLVLGLVIWLIAAGILANPMFIAAVVGAANGAALVGGWLLIRLTRYQTAGKGLTLVACLVMPLNLWFYHAQDLLTVQGHLWVAALIISLLYAVSAMLLRDATFVYVLMGGLTMTGVLVLGDMYGSLFMAVAPHCTLFVVLGAVAVFLSQAFPPGKGAFSREEFGMAFYWSGQPLVAGGLLVLLITQFYGWVHPVIAGANAGHLLPGIVTEPDLKWLAVGLVLTGMVVYGFSDIVVRRIGVYMYLAVFCMLWAEILLINLIPGLSMTTELVIAAFALTALVANLLNAQLGKRDETFLRTGPPLAVFLSIMPLTLGAILHLRATYAGWNHLWPYQVNWGYVGALALTAISCRVGAFLYRRSMPQLSATYFFGTAAATILGAAGLLSQFGVKDWTIQALFLIMIPILYVVAARLYRGHAAEKPLLLVAHVATGVIALAVLASGLNVAQRVFELISGDTRNLLIAVFFAEACLFYVLTIALHRQENCVYAASAAATASIWQILIYYQVAPEIYALAFALVGLALLIVHRLALLEQRKLRQLAHAAFHSGNTLQLLAFIAVVLITLARLAHADDDRRQLTHMLLLGGFAVQSVIAARLVEHQRWRELYIILAVCEVVLALIVAQVFLDLPAWRKLEIFVCAGGVVLLAAGHWGWYREKESQSELVSMYFALGSLAVGLPLTFVLLWQRLGAVKFSAPDELALLFAGILMISTGIVCRIRATTITGGLMLLIFLVTLLRFIPMPGFLRSASFWMVVGGLVVFGLGLFLSLCRDWLLKMPDRLKRREGVFRLLTWR